MPPEQVVDYPNRRKTSSKVTKWVVVLLLLVSVALMVVVSVGGWALLQGAKAVQIAYVAVFVLCALLIARWRSGVLPVVAALAMVLLIFAAVSGPEWLDRDQPGFAASALPPDVLGLLTLVLVPVQVLLMAFALSGFRQRWQVEVDVPRDDDERRRPGRGAVALPG